MADNRHLEAFLDDSNSIESSGDGQPDSLGGEETPLNRAVAGGRGTPLLATTGIGDSQSKKELQNTSSDGMSWREAFFHVLKGNIGTGLLGLPAAFAFAGLPFGVIGMALICALAVHCMYLLVKCAGRLRETSGKKDLHYAKVAELAFLCLPPPLCRYGKVGKNIVNTFLIITQMGLCCVYVLFVAVNVQQVFAASGVTVTENVLIVGSLLLFLPGTFIRKLKHLSPLSGVATLVQVVSILIIFAYLIIHTHIGEVKVVPTQPALFFGVAVFSMEGVCLVLPLENGMRDRRQFSSALGAGMIVTTVLYLTMGVLGAIAFAQPQGSITLDLPSEGVAKNIPYIYVRLFYAFSIFATYFIQFYVPMAIMDHKVAKFCGKRLKPYTPYLLRTFFVAISAAVAVVVPRLDLAISLVGSFSSSTLALIFPPILELVIFWKEKTLFMIVKNIFIATVGTLGMIIGTYTALSEMIKHK